MIRLTVSNPNHGHYSNPGLGNSMLEHTASCNMPRIGNCLTYSDHYPRYCTISQPHNQNRQAAESDRHQRQGGHTSHHRPHKCSSICLHSRMRSTTSSTVLTTQHSGRGPSNTARIAPIIWSVSVHTRPHALYPACLQLAPPPLLRHPQNTTCKRYLCDWQFSDSTHCCACKYRTTLKQHNTSNCAQPCRRGTTGTLPGITGSWECSKLQCSHAPNIMA